MKNINTKLATIAIGALALTGFANSALADPIVSGRMFYDMTNVNRTTNGIKHNTSGVGIDVTRMYIGVDNKFTDNLSGSVTLDFAPAGSSGNTTGNSEVFIKKAYVKYKFDDALSVTLGANDMPWVPYVEDLYGLRYFQTVMADRSKFGTSTDWGLFASGKLNENFSYSVAAVNGNGYRKHIRGATMDFEGRLSAKFDFYNFAIGGYSGKLGAQKGATFAAPTTTTPTVGPVRTATRFDALAGYKGERFAFVVEGFNATNYAGSNPVSLVSTNTNKAEGVSVFTSYRVTPKTTVFARHDHVVTDFKATTSGDVKDKFSTFGVSYNLYKNVDFSFAYKNTETKTARTSLLPAASNESRLRIQEVGVWAQYRF